MILKLWFTIFFIFIASFDRNIMFYRLLGKDFNNKNSFAYIQVKAYCTLIKSSSYEFMQKKNLITF